MVTGPLTLPLACCTVTVWFATVSVPVRAGSQFAPAVKLAAPGPVPPDEMEIQLTLLAADHPQPAVVVTVTAPVPPVAGIERVEGCTANVQPGFGVGFGLVG